MAAKIDSRNKSKISEQNSFHFITVPQSEVMNFNRMKVSNLIFNALCILGCAYQLQNVFESYFKYGTITRYQIFAPTSIYFPELHVCSMYLCDLLDWNQVEQKYGRIYPRMDKRWMDTLTISDILTYTPDVVPDQCTYRDKTGTAIIKSAMKNCTMFKTKKYILQNYVCYNFIAKKIYEIIFDLVHGSLEYDRTLYELRLSGPLTHASKLRVTISQKGFLDFGRVYAPGYYKKKQDQISLQVSCNNITNTWLGYPYDPFRCSRQDEDFYRCVEECIKNHTMSQYGRFPYLQFYEKKD